MCIRDRDATVFANSAPADGAHLGFLGDVFHTPAWLPIHNVFSIGDLVIVTGAFVLLHLACGTPLGRLPRRLRPADA